MSVDPKSSPEMGSAGLKTGSLTGLILGIESSCDETAAAIVREGRETLSNIVASQIATHQQFGGVVPELASREHLRNIVPVVRAALRQAGVTFRDLDAIAVTSGPGLAGALLVGLTYAKFLAFGLGKPLIAVNHLEGHIYAVLLEQAAAQETHDTPSLALVVSGGHTHLYLARRERSWAYQNVGKTVDDAAGEAFDKVAKLLGLPYPGGPWIDALARQGNPKAVPFAFAQIKAKKRPGRADQHASHAASKARISPDGGDPHLALEAMEDSRTEIPLTYFSFSGIKTAVLRYVETHDMRSAIEARHRALTAIERPTVEDVLSLCDQPTLDLIASFQHAVVGDLLSKCFRAAQTLGVRSLIVTGGVAANSELRARFTAEAVARSLSLAFPSVTLSTDNAAMIAAAGWPKFIAQDFAATSLNAEPNLRLGGA